ncbi:hypothetical protein, partial [Megasphaera sp.]|uniref:hypothetical protein n=1 Tax=Megasphaera sp. TaxID=2023260 RepID=UPI0040273C40
SLFLSFKFVVFSLQQMVKKLKSASTNYKLRTTNYKVKGALHDGKNLRATSPFFICKFLS